MTSFFFGTQFLHADPEESLPRDFTSMILDSSFTTNDCLEQDSHYPLPSELRVFSTLVSLVLQLLKFPPIPTANNVLHKRIIFK